MSGNARLALQHVSKYYGLVAAVKDASLEFDEGILHLVCGENGAGKSTLLKIGAGIVAPDEGRVLVLGKDLAPHTPASALAHGIAMVTQHFALAPALTVLENIALAERGRLDLKASRARVTKRLSTLGFALPLDTRAADLSVAQKQRTEIVRALLTDASVLILDEPTAVLARAEVDALYKLLRSLLAEKKAVIVVTHKMDEVRRFADRVTVMQKGEVRFTKDVPRDDPQAMSAFMANAVREIMGDAKPLHKDESRAAPAPKKARLVLTSIAELSGATFTVHEGEIVGIAGIEGNGQGELVQALEDANADPRITIDGTPKVHGDIAFVHEDRIAQGLVLEASARENLMLGDFPEKHFLIDRESLQKQAVSRASRVAFTRELDVLAGDLSGGNQQKLVVGRALGRERARAFVFVHPTRGVDIKASAEIHARILEVAAHGNAVIVVSSDTDELRALSDRILVLRKCALVSEFSPSVTEEELGAAMLTGGNA